jgi:hypothetical protein
MQARSLTGSVARALPTLYIRQRKGSVKTSQAATMTEAAIMPSETLWQKIRDEAQRAAAADPIFGRTLGGLIFAHDDFTAAVSDLIGRRLGDSAAERARFTTFSRDAFNGQVKPNSKRQCGEEPAPLYGKCVACKVLKRKGGRYNAHEDE